MKVGRKKKRKEKQQQRRKDIKPAQTKPVENKKKSEQITEFNHLHFKRLN